MRGVRRSLVVLAVAVLTASCSKKDPVVPIPPTPPGAVGTVRGIVTAANGVTPIGQASVSLAATGTPSTTADAQGAYTLTGVPVGVQSLRIKKGNFEKLVAVSVVENDTVTAPPAALVPAGKLAFVPGSFDAIEAIVRDSLGNAMDELAATDLGTTATLNQYRMIFLDCGLDQDPSLDAPTIAALRAWVRAGGTLYASDWAMAYVQALLPTDIIATDTAVGQDVTASVSDAALQAFLGKSTAAIRYDLPGWIGLEQISSRPRVLLRGAYESDSGPVTDRPLAIVVTEGAGRIVYTSFHNEAGVTPDQIGVLRFFIYIE